MVESRALLKLRAPKGLRGFESLPHRHSFIFNLAATTYQLTLILSLGIDGNISLEGVVTCPLFSTDFQSEQSSCNVDR